MSERIRGIFTPNIVPLDGRGEIHEQELRHYVDWLIQRGVHGLYPNGSTGEFVRFTAAERRRIVEIITDQARGRVPILAGAAEANTAETIRACEHYAGLGVRAVAIVSPFYYRLSSEGVYAYFKEIADHSPVDITLYNIPLFASPIEVGTVIRLAEECPRVVAIKDSSGDVPNMMRMIAAIRPRRADFSFLTGWEAVLTPMLLIGCDGGTNATSGIVPEVTRRLYDLTVEGKLQEALDLQFRLLRLFDAMLFPAEFPEGFRVALNLRGIRTGPGRQPQSTLQQQDLAKLQQQLYGLLTEEGWTEGLPTSEDQIAQIVRQVLDDLQQDSTHDGSPRGSSVSVR